MKLTKKNIQQIDDFLVTQKVKYLDIRSELIDHLATEFEEESNYILIEDYLRTKIYFIKDFAKKQQKVIHWSYQKQLWVQFAKFFYKPKFMFLLVLLNTLGYILIQLFSLENFSLICFFVLIGLIFYPLLYQIKHRKAVKHVQYAQSLFTVTSLPSVFLYTFTAIKGFLFERPFLLIVYCWFSILLGVSAVILIEKDRKKILEKYNRLLLEK